MRFPRPHAASWTQTLTLCAGLLLAVSAVIAPQRVAAQTDIYVRGAQRRIPIALPRLCVQGGSGEAAREIPEVIARDLDLSGYFEVLNPGSYIESAGKCGGPDSVAYSDWTVIGADGLARGAVTDSGGQLRVQLYLHDVPRQGVVLAKEYTADATQTRKIAHRFANEIMKYFTGEYGPFGTQIAFSTKVGRFKELALMDMDGANIRQLTAERGLAVSSSWDRAGQRLVYTSYRKREPDLFVLDLASRRIQQITSTPALEVSPIFTPDGNGIVAALERAGNTHITQFGLNGQVLRTLTSGNRALDVSPDWSPDGRQLVFCSNRGGGPQIYKMNSDGSGITRVSFAGSNYCTSPTWSPKGDKIAYVCRGDGGFQLFVSNPAGGDVLQLTGGGDNEDPDWSPDGRYLVFASSQGRTPAFKLMLIRADGSNLKQLTNSRQGDSEPSWGPQQL